MPIGLCCSSTTSIATKARRTRETYDKKSVEDSIYNVIKFFGIVLSVASLSASLSLSFSLPLYLSLYYPVLSIGHARLLNGQMFAKRMACVRTCTTYTGMPLQSPGLLCDEYLALQRQSLIGICVN